MQNSSMAAELQKIHSDEIIIRSRAVEDGVIRGPIALWMIRYYRDRLQGTVRENNLECHDYDTVARAVGELRSWVDKQTTLYF